MTDKPNNNTADNEKSASYKVREMGPEAVALGAKLQEDARHGKIINAVADDLLGSAAWFKFVLEHPLQVTEVNIEDVASHIDRITHPKAPRAKN